MATKNLVFCFLASLFVVSFSGHVSETGCPDAEEIAPCICHMAPFAILDCKNIDDADTLRTVFLNSANYTYNEVYLQYSTLQYLPHEMFESVPVKEMNLINVTLAQLFDAPPEALTDLHKLHIENTKVFRGILWELMEPLQSLRIVEIYSIPIETLGKDFSKYVTKNLEQIAFAATETKTVKPGVFNDFPKLDKVEISISKLKDISREAFPRPFNGRILYFNSNHLTYVPDDMFSDMPNLQSLGMTNNKIATIPESAFSGTGSKLEYLFLEGNPIKCDCRIAWLLNRKPAINILTGACEVPKLLHNRPLHELSAADLHCTK